eukprot:TRINITY_DN6976_c0_g2_i1.p1 TRINITY_DN6976_c0_g2~~TRINITY_DN6976_c0_g2_i1.p1  ORF type:complete len:791 (+),score=140.27 TRINITY_DN6976_c0_g2_i1:66-2438(+)
MTDFAHTNKIATFIVKVLFFYLIFIFYNIVDTGIVHKNIFPQQALFRTMFRRVRFFSRCWAHQRIPVSEHVDLIVVDNINIHGNKRHPEGAICAAMCTDGLRNSFQHEILFMVQYPFAKPGVIPNVVSNTIRYVSSLNKMGGFVRGGDMLDLGQSGNVLEFGCLGDNTGSKAITFTPAPAHDEYWKGEHEFKVPPYPTLIASILTETERSVAGFHGAASRVFASQSGYFKYGTIPYVQSAILPLQESMPENPLFENTDSLLLSRDLHTPASTNSLRLNYSSVVLSGNILTLRIPNGVGEFAHGPLSEMYAERKDKPVTLYCDVPEDEVAADRGLQRAVLPEDLSELGTLESVITVPMNPSMKVSNKDSIKVFGSGITFDYFDDETHIDSMDVISSVESKTQMQDADSCIVTMHNDMFSVKLRHRSWVKLLSSLQTQKSFLCPSHDKNGVHFEVRWTHGAELPYFQKQTEASNSAFLAMKEEAMSAFTSKLPTDDVTAQESVVENDNTETDEEGLQEIKDPNQNRTVLLVTGNNLSESQKQKLRIAGGGHLVTESLSELKAPMNPNQMKKFTEELHKHKALSDAVTRDIAKRKTQTLEANIIRIVWSHDETDPNSLATLEQELAGCKNLWKQWRTHLISVIMNAIEDNKEELLNLPDSKVPDISPNLCIKVLTPSDAGTDIPVYGLLIKDNIIKSSSVIMDRIRNDETLKDMPLTFSFDLFLNVALRGTYSSARRRTTQWTDLESHYRSLSQEAADRLSSLEKEERKLKSRQLEIEKREKELGIVTSDKPS